MNNNRRRNFRSRPQKNNFRVKYLIKDFSGNVRCVLSILEK